ncbi:MAG: PDZ domain-containing protein [Geoalkalibacter sp.]|jgi:carboxyl-terminal processing protease|uniref:PDZ domain-containing protein n=1 Tax=Geoalkalibacter sp. TaxID=3041440 RepID=UPI002A9425E6|nr:PDZ domain-containing protein [Thermodesulfobacteriota bacterium]
MFSAIKTKLGRFCRFHIFAGFAFALLLAGSGFAPAAEGDFGGVGLQVVPTARGELVVLAVVAGTPAEKQGLEPGDLIIAVDGYPLQGTNFQAVVRELLWGPVGSRAVLSFKRPGVAGVRQVDVVRIALEVDDKQSMPGVRMLLPGEDSDAGKKD